MSRGASLAQDLIEGLRREPGRILLSLFAVSIGFCALLLVLSVLDYFRVRSKELVAELGANVVAVLPNASRGGGLRREDVSRLQATLPHCRITSCLFVSADASNGERVQIIGTDEDFIPVRRLQIARGRPLDSLDVARAERHAVVHAQMAARLHLEPGDVLSLDRTLVTVVGVVQPAGGALEAASAHPSLRLGPEVVLVPWPVAQAWRRESPGGNAPVDIVFIEYPPGRAALVMEMLNREFDANAVSVITPETLVAGLRRWQNAVRVGGGGIATLCLLLGATTLSSLLLADVRDRVPEIGLRRALGASRGDIAWLFVAESSAVTTTAALLGALLATAITSVIRRRFQIPLHLSGLHLLAIIAGAWVLGGISAWAPAAAATRLSPAEALRNE